MTNMLFYAFLLLCPGILDIYDCSFPLVLGLFSAGAMGFWHTVEHYEKMKINERSDVELFVKSWPPVLVGGETLCRRTSVHSVNVL